MLRFRNGEEITSDEHILIDTSEEGQVSSTLTIDHFTKDDVADVISYKVIKLHIY